MIRKAVINSQVLSGLRMRYSPRSRIGQGVISLAPWLNLVLLLGLIAILDSRVVLQPGVVVRLPEASFAEGSPPGHTAVVLSIASPSGARDVIVVFNDERFLVGDRQQETRLRDALAVQARRRPDAPLILHVDERVSHGTVLKLVNTAREVGLKEVALSTRDSSSAPARGDAAPR